MESRHSDPDGTSEIAFSRMHVSTIGVRIVLWLTLVLGCLPMVSGCARYQVNPRLENLNTTIESTRPVISSPTRSDELLLVLAFSGGGTRAAALSYGVLKALEQIRVPVSTDRLDSPNTEDFHSLANEIDVISSVSGGSFTSAYYGLYGERTFDDFKERFLYRNVNRGLLTQIIRPINWPRIASPFYGRSDLATEYYDRLLFDGATFEDLWSQDGPEIMIQATDIADGIRFGFSRYNFALICSDLAAFPIARAVAASSAFPGPFNGISLKNYAGTCGFQEEDWVVNALEERDVSDRTFHTAEQVHSYHDPDKKAFVHLLDGGISDNIGIRSPLEMIIARGGIRESLEQLGLQDTRRIVFLIVNAEGEIQNDWGALGRTPGVAQALGATSSVLISSYNYETVDLLHRYFKEWSAEAKRSASDGPPLEFYSIEVGFNTLRNEEERIYFSSIPTSFNLPRNNIDDLIDVAKRILYGSKQFQKLVGDLGGKIPSEDSRTVDAGGGDTKEP